MEKERFIDRLKRADGWIWILFAGFIIAGLFLIIGGSKIYSSNKGTETGTIAIICIALGVICEVLFISMGIVVPFIQWKKGITAESKLVWQSGILTADIIKKDITADKRTKTIGYFVFTGLLLLLAVPIVVFAEEIDIGAFIIAVLPFVTLFLAIREIISAKKDCVYRIEEDRVIRTEIKTTFDAIDAVTNHLPTKTPTIYFEKYGEYPVDCMQIHAYYPPEQIVALIGSGEEVYIVFSQNSNKILHIYRKKFWSLEKR